MNCAAIANGYASTKVVASGGRAGGRRRVGAAAAAAPPEEGPCGSGGSGQGKEGGRGDKAKAGANLPGQ